MIEGECLKELFKDIVINGIPVTTHYGDQKELNAWIASRTRTSTFPLIWCVINKITPINSTQINVNSQLILFQLSNNQMLNSERFTKNYQPYLIPLYDKVNSVLKANNFVNLKDARFGIQYIDEPNYGVQANTVDFSSSNTTKQKSVTIQTVDARILFLNMDINPNCILIN